jgi:hypothetical protein
VSYLAKLHAWGLLLLLSALSGCAIAPMANDGEPLSATQGLVAFRISSTDRAKLSYVEYSGVATLGSHLKESITGPKSAFLFPPGDKYYVAALDAGEYMWSRFDVYPAFSWVKDSNPKFAWLQATNRFRVQANTITYIGHIYVHVHGTRLSLEAVDREDDMRAFLMQTYPIYVNRMPMKKALAELRLR